MKSEKSFRIYEILLNILITTIVFITNFAQNQTYFLTKANFSMHFYTIYYFLLYFCTKKQLTFSNQQRNNEKLYLQKY